MSSAPSSLRSVVPQRRAIAITRQLAAITTLCISLYALWNWWRGDWTLAAVLKHTVPVAPSTALLLLMLSISAILQREGPPPTTVRVLTIGTCVVVFAAAALVIVQNLAGWSSLWERWLFDAPGTVRGIPVGRMSPLTAALFILTGISLLSEDPVLRRRLGLQTTGPIACLLAGGFSGFTLLAYATGTPLFYGGSLVPVAFLTALAFFCLNTSLLSARRIDRKFRHFFFGEAEVPGLPKSSVSHQRLFAAGTTVLLIAITLIASLYLGFEQARQKDRISTDLRQVAELKIDQLSTWRQERLSDARLLVQTPFLARSLRALASGQTDPALSEKLDNWLRQIATTYEFESVVLFDRNLQPVLRSQVKPGPILPYDRGLLGAVLQSRDAMLGELRRSPDGSVYLDIAAPIIRAQDEKPIGVILLCVDPSIYLYPIVARWPVPDSSAETFLIRREGDSLVYLSGLQNMPRAALTLRRSAKDTHALDANLVAAGRLKIDEGLDYQGTPVLGIGLPVPDTSWFMISEIPQSEVYGPLRREASWVAVLTVAVLCAGAFGAGLLWRRRSHQTLQRAFLAEQAQSATAKRLSLVMQHANDIIVLTDDEGRVVDANARAESAYGYTADELRRLPPLSLRASAVPDEREQNGHAMYETLHRRKDGSTFPVEINRSSFEIEGRRFHLGVCRDISQRKDHEQQIDRLNRIYAALSRVNHAVVASNDRQSLFASVCRALVEFGQFKMAWIASRAPGNSIASVVAQYGDNTGYLQRIRVDLDAPSDTRGPTSIAIEEGRTYVCNNFDADPRTASWRKDAALAGFKSAISLPVRESQITVYALTVYLGEPGAFAEKEIALLEEVSGDISFGLDHLAKEAAIRDVNDRMATLVECSPLAIVVLDNSGVVEVWNPAAEEMYGWKQEEVLGKPLATIPPHLLEETHRLHAALTQGQPIPIQETQRQRRDGTVIDVSISFASMKDAHGKVIRTLGLQRDITDRKRAEAALRTSESKFRALFENSIDGFMLTDPRTGRILEANPAACRLLDRTEEAMRLLEHQDIVAMDDPRIGQMMEQRNKTGHTVGEATLIRSDGLRFEAELASVIYSTDEGPRTSMAIHDITERKARERRIREQAELLDKANEAIVATDLQGRITFWNNGAERLFGGAAASRAGHSITDILAIGTSDSPSAALAAFTRLEDWRGEAKSHNSAGQPMVIETSVTLLRDESGQPSGRLTISTDVTEKKILEEKFLRSQRLESIGMLAAGIAHDLNNVLAPISMAVPILRDHALDADDIQMLNTLERCAERGAGLARQILGFAQGISGEPRIVQIKHLVRDIGNVVTQTFSKSISLNEEVPSDLWPVIANPTQIHQVLLNLCVNARDAMPSGGTLTLRAENRRLDERAAAAIEGASPGAWVLLRVVDTGTGIPPEVLPHIWEPFFTTKEAGKGTGLGLSTVRGIVDTHHGFVNVTSAAGQGTCFCIYLPAAEVSETAEATVASTPRPAGRGELILVVDDEQSIRDTVGAILVRDGFRVALARNGEEGAELYSSRSDDFALVISDLDMPKVDGVALGRFVQSLHPGAKFLAMSGLPEDSRVAEITRETASIGFLRKPFTIVSLLNAVRALLPGD